MGLMVCFFLALVPLADIIMAIPRPVRVWLITGAMAPIYLTAGGWIRWRFGAAIMRPLVAGSVVQALLLFSIRMSAEADGAQYNEVAFGWPGLLLALTMPPLGGLLGARLPARQERPLAPEGKAALTAALLWVGLEFVLRRDGTLLLAQLTGSVQGGDMLAVLPGFPLLALLIARLGKVRGLGRERWGVRWDRTALAAGLAGGVLMLALLPVTTRLDFRLFGQATAQLAAQAGAGTAHPLWVASLLMVTNGLVIPVTEELAWRGVIQSGLTLALGVLRGLLLTAGLFALKHVLVDGSAARLTTLLMLSLVLGLVRWRWGTGASIAAHVVMNLGGTALLLLAP